MSWLTYLALHLIHALYVVFKSLLLLWKSFDAPPLPLTVPRKQVPTHLAVVLVSDDDSPLEPQRLAMLRNVEQLTSWCKEVGIGTLTVYDREGILHDSVIDWQHQLQFSDDSSNSSTESEPDYPLTPPLSDISESRTLTPEMVPPPLQLHTIHIPCRPVVKRRRDTRNILKRRKHSYTEETSEVHPITLHIISRMTGKPAVARMAHHFLQVRMQTKAMLHEGSDACYSVEDIETCLQGEHGLPPPDLLLVHEMSPSEQLKPLELHGFPPWQIRLTEFHQTDTMPWRRERREVGSGYASSLLEESEFRRALDQFAAAEMRLGK